MPVALVASRRNHYGAQQCCTGHRSRLWTDNRRENAPRGFLALNCRTRNDLRYSQQVREIESRVPATVVFAVSCNRGSICPLLQLLQPFKGLLHLLLATNNADEILHH